MATRRPRRSEWHQVDGRWARSLGERGTRVRLFQKRRGGVFFRDVWIPGRGKNRKCLGTSDRAEADRLGRLLLSALLREDDASQHGPLTLSALWVRYRREAATFLDNGSQTRADADTRAAILLAFFGTECDVRSLSERDQRGFTQKRLVGGIPYRDRKGVERVSQPARPRSVEADLVLLHAMLRWATTVRSPGGGRLLEFHPLSGVRRVRELNPKRAVATWERYLVTRAALKKLAAETNGERARSRWVRLELALVLAEATGRRIGSIRQLLWEDVDFERGEIRWRAETDKKRKEWVIPTPPALLEELRAFQRRLGVIGGLMFPGERKPGQPMDRHLFDKWLAHAEREAQLPKLDGALWHAYRRKWATERKHLPLKDVAAAGGWVDVETLLRSYQQPDKGTLLAVMNEPRKLSEIVSAGQ